MIGRPATALRLALHLLLAACLLLQASVAFALGTTMAAATTDAPSVAAVPPCHAATATATATTVTAAIEHAQPHADPGCCSDDGGLCEWVCAGAPPLAAARFAMVLPTAIVAPAPTIAVAAPRWPVSTPLRPPIA